MLGVFTQTYSFLRLYHLNMWHHYPPTWLGHKLEVILSFSFPSYLQSISSFFTFKLYLKSCHFLSLPLLCLNISHYYLSFGLLQLPSNCTPCFCSFLPLLCVQQLLWFFFFFLKTQHCHLEAASCFPACLE